MADTATEYHSAGLEKGHQAAFSLEAAATKKQNQSELEIRVEVVLVAKRR